MGNAMIDWKVRREVRAAEVDTLVKMQVAALLCCDIDLDNLLEERLQGHGSAKDRLIIPSLHMCLARARIR